MVRAFVEQPAPSFLLKESFHLGEITGFAVVRKALEKDLAISFLGDAVIQQGKRAAILQRTDQASKALLQRDHGRRHLVIEESVSSFGVNGANTRGHYRVIGDGKGQPVNNHAAQLLTLHIYPLPKRRGCEQDGIRREAKFFQQSAALLPALNQHGEFQLSQQAVVDLMHLGVAGEKTKGAPSGNFQQPPDAFGSPRNKLRRPW